VVLSVTEGEDKPLKYPDMFRAAKLMLINKSDLLPYVPFNVETCVEYARRVNPDIEVIELSALTGDGLDEWYSWITKHENQHAPVADETGLIAQTVKLPASMPTVLGMGAFLKSSLCLIEGDKAQLTHTAGDLSTLEAVEHYQSMLVAMVERAGGAEMIKCAAHDLHPDFHSTTQATELGCETLAIQHHHAHVAATTAEHHHSGPVLGLVLDGFGLGERQEAWGGELLRVDGLEYTRIGHLAHLAQPGGDIAACEPWRMGAAALHALGRGDEIAVRYKDQPHADLLSQMLDKAINSPQTSSCGRLFDAACGLLSIRPVAEFEGQAPMEMEALATRPVVHDHGWEVTADGVLDLSRLLNELPDHDAITGSNLFHGTLSAALADWVLKAREKTGLEVVAFGGGCFFNKVMSALVQEALEAEGMKVLRPEKLSPGDAALSFGQAWLAALSVERAN